MFNYVLRMVKFSGNMRAVRTQSRGQLGLQKWDYGSSSKSYKYMD